MTENIDQEPAAAAGEKRKIADATESPSVDNSIQKKVQTSTTQEPPQKAARIEERAATASEKAPPLPTSEPSPPQGGSKEDSDVAPTSKKDEEGQILDAFQDIDVFLFDIEGTVCQISFVKDVLFPYALKALPQVLDRRWEEPDFIPYREAFPKQYSDDRKAFEQHVRDLMAQDVKVAYLKSLQGHLWQEGYEKGKLKAPLFADVPPFLKAIDKVGKKVMIYSSGSVPAQKLLFGHTTGEPSDLKPLIHGWFDTTNAGDKTKATSYQKILSAEPNVSASKWVFFSDNLSEVDAALEAGMRSLPVIRPGNPVLSDDNPLKICAIQSFTITEAEKAMTALAAFEKTRELDGTIEKQDQETKFS